MRIYSKVRRSGFTLLELLAVMAVMAIMTTIGTMGYFAAVKGAAARGTLEHLTQAISFARQTAIMQGRRVYVVFGPTKEDDWFAVCKEDGMLTYCSGGLIGDEYADWNDFVGGTNMMVFNLTTRPVDTGEVVSASVEMVFGISQVILKVQPMGTFSAANQLYGWEVMPRRALARGLYFEKAYDPIIFEPDGSTEEGGQIRIHEAATGKITVQVDVSAGTGFVTATLDPSS